MLIFQNRSPNKPVIPEATKDKKAAGGKDCNIF